MTETNEKWTKAPVRSRKMRMVRRLVPDARRELVGDFNKSCFTAVDTRNGS